MKPSRLLLVQLFMAAALSANAQTTHYVWLDGENIPPFDKWQKAATNIQAAVTAATNGDTVLVTNGTYLLTSQISITNGITVRSVNGAAVTVVDGGYPAQANRCFYLANSNAILDGLTITGGMTNYGGGVYSAVGGTIQNCMITGNLATGPGWSTTVDGKGGGIYFANNGVVSNCIIAGNVSLGDYANDGGGGGIYAQYGGIVAKCVITNNSASGAGANGGGALLQSGGAIEDCTFSGNWSGGGGGVYCAGSMVKNCTLTNNLGWSSVFIDVNGGGIYCTGGAVVSNCLIAANSSLASSSSGGGVECDHSRVVDCKISNNQAVWWGGGITIWDPESVVSNCLIVGNSGGNGAVYCFSGEITDCEIVNNSAPGVHLNGGGHVKNCTIRRNSQGAFLENGGLIEDCLIASNTNATHGGGIYFWDSGAIRNCVMSSNAAAYGGGVYFDMSNLGRSNAASVESCTITANSASSSGGGVFSSYGGTLTNTIIYFNTAASGANCADDQSPSWATYVNCCTTPVRGTTCVTNEPGFVNLAAGDNHLVAGSPCINAGTNQSWMANGTDLDGHSRIVCGTVDIGAYEWLPSLTPGFDGTHVQLSWPANCLGWELQAQTNWQGVGLGTNWFPLAGSTTNTQMSIPIDPANGSVFYRLHSQ